MKEESKENGDRSIKINRTLKGKKKNRYYTYIVGTIVRKQHRGPRQIAQLFRSVDSSACKTYIPILMGTMRVNLTGTMQVNLKKKYEKSEKDISKGI